MHKTSKRWIENDQDLETMYKAFNSGDEITIWCEGKKDTTRNSRKRKAEEPDITPSTKQTDAIDELAHELYEKHGQSYSMPQLHLWARMVLNKQYKSMDIAPPHPPFQGHIPKTPKRDNLTDALTSAATAVVNLLNGRDSPVSTATSMSPGKWARVSGQYLEHLERLKGLHQSGVLSLTEFEE